jgi:L-threonylcarbamoyladenylate synthase
MIWTSMAERIYLDDLIKSPDAPSAFAKLAKRIEAGQVFVYPTETIYGIGGRADSEAVKKRIIKAKTRKPENPMILMAGNKRIFENFGIIFPSAGEFLAGHFWPGQLTLVLPFLNGKGTTGVRVSDHPFILKLYESLDLPIFSTSANISGQAYVNSPDEIFSIFESKIDFMIDAGILPPSPPSTVVKVLDDKKIELSREGVIEAKEILTAFIKYSS